METDVRRCILPSNVIIYYVVRMGSFVVGEDDTQSIPFAKQHVRRCIGMCISNGLCHLWREAGSASLRVRSGR